MRNLLALIQRFYILLLFIALQTIALILLFRNNNFHRSEFVEHSSDAVGFIYSKRDKLSRYLRLEQINYQLAVENAILRSHLPANFDVLDTASGIYTDSLKYQRFKFRSAKVINVTINREQNFITIDRGQDEGIEREMGVISDGALVGIISSVSDHFSVVMPVLNSKFQGSVRMKKSGDFGIVVWTGGDPAIAEVIEVPKQTIVSPGDTVITSGYSRHFPANLMVGTVVEVEEPDNAYHLIKIRLSADFRKLNYVQVISDIYRAEQDSIEQIATQENGANNP
ncbi:MAG: rod shape-determining protein MreC [Crocinitomicaceae bacterium]|nr:rod shape-determining protein MreC [Crocinitomicaceae bacterium]